MLENADSNANAAPRSRIWDTSALNPDRSSIGNDEPGLRRPGVTLRTQLVAVILAATLPLVVLMTARTVAEAGAQRQGLMALFTVAREPLRWRSTES